jgi:hypothetical protein
VRQREALTLPSGSVGCRACAWSGDGGAAVAWENNRDTTRHDEQRLRLPLQALAYRRLRRGQVLSLAQIRREHIHHRLRLYHWCGFQDQNHRIGWEDHQATNLGYCRPREI